MPTAGQKDAYELCSRRSTRANSAPATGWWSPSSPSASACRGRRSARRCSGWRPKAVLARDGRSLVVVEPRPRPARRALRRARRARGAGGAARRPARGARGDAACSGTWRAATASSSPRPERARPRQQALPPPDPPREPQPLPDPAARDGAPLDGAARHHLARRRRPRRPRRSTSTTRSSAPSRRATAPPPRRRSARHISRAFETRLKLDAERHTAATAPAVSRSPPPAGRAPSRRRRSPAGPACSGW